MYQLFRIGANMLPAGAALLALVLVVVLFVEMARSERAHQEVTAAALSDYADVAAWQYVRRAEQELRATLGPALNAMRGYEPGQDMDTLHERAVLAVERCHCQHGTKPDLTFRFDGEALELSGDESLLDGRVLRSQLAGQLAPFEAGQTQQRGLHIASMNGEAIALGYVVHQIGSPVVTGYLARTESIRRTLAEVFDRHELLPASLLGDRAQSDVLLLRVDGAGEVLYESGSLGGPWRGRAEFGALTEQFAGLTVETALRPPAAEVLLVGGTPRSRLPLLATLAGLALLLSLFAVWQFFVERRLVRMRTDTIARISHELRTPLAQIRLFTETLRLGRARDKRESERALAVIDRESRRLDHLVNNVLHFGARERGCERMTPERLALDGFLKEITKEFSPLAQHHEVTVETAVEGPLRVQADPEALRRITLNLLDNAAKYSPSGGRVRISAVAGETGRVRMCVDDSGPGVPPVQREQVWEMYGRLDGNEAPGSGIGLALVRHYAGLLGGCAWVEDAPGGGARFVVELPAEETG